jgi:hypothetical protein
MVQSKRFASLVLIALCLAGCASTSLVEEWKEPSYNGPAYKKVLVVGASSSPARRRAFETEFVKQLDKRVGVQGIPSHTLIPDEQQVTREELARVIQNSGIEAVMMTRLIGTEQNIHYTPGTVSAYPYGWYGGMYDYYYGAWGQVSSPGYLTTSTTVRLETNVYDVATEKLVWAGVTESFSPSDVEQLTDELAAVVLRNMSEYKIL